MFCRAELSRWSKLQGILDSPLLVPDVTTAVSYLRALAVLKVPARGAEVASGGKILSRICSQLTKTFFLTRSAIFCTLLVVFRNFYLPLTFSAAFSGLLPFWLQFWLQPWLTSIWTAECTI